MQKWVSIEPNIENYLSNPNKVHSILQFSHAIELQTIKKSNEQCIEQLVEKINTGIDLLQKEPEVLKEYRASRIEE